MPATTTLRARTAVVAIFFFSGISGLVYQVVWVREFARIFGNTIHSAALVSGVFMGGLGAGSYVLGRHADRRFRADPAHPLRVYAYSELAIAALGLLNAAALPRMVVFSAAISSYAQGEHGWYELSLGSHVARYAIAIAMVAPATFLMGGTLTLLIRFLVGEEVEKAGFRIGVLYAANTAGAALGALLTDFVLVQRLGLVGTQVVAASVNVAAGLGALAVLASGAARAAPKEGTPRPEPGAQVPEGAWRSLALTGAALLLSGFAAMGLEILWFRYLGEILGALRLVFSLLLAVLLTGIWVGSALGAFAYRRLGRPVVLFAVTQTLLVVVTAGVLGLVDPADFARTQIDSLSATFAAASPARRALLELWSNLRAIGLVAGAPAVLMGCAFPLANAIVQRASATVAGRAGILYLANTAGNVLGSAAVGFFVLPALGIQRTTLGLLACAAASLVPLSFLAREDEKAPRRARRATFAGCAVALGLALVGFWCVPDGHLLQASVPRGDQGGSRNLLEVSEGLNETIAITEVPGYETRLFTNGHSMSGNGPKAQRYMRAFSHLPLLQMESPKRALVICFGTGSTLHAASLHPSIEHLELADLSRHVLEHHRYFSASNHGVIDDPRVSVFVNDGRHHLAMQAEASYDLITLEPPPIAFAGVSALYSREFFELARSRLRPGGFVTDWLPGYQVGGEGSLSIVRAFVDAFPESVLLSGDGDELILMGTTGSTIAMDPAALVRRLHERPAVAADLTGVDLGEVTEIVGSFAASHATMAHAAERTAPLTDDRPSLEYTRLSRLGAHGIHRMPRDLFDTTGVDAWCPGCVARLPGLGAYLRLEERIYASDSFLTRGASGEGPSLGDSAEGAATLASSLYLRGFVSGEAAIARRAARRNLAQGRPDLALGALRFAIYSSPLDPEGHEDAAAALRALGDPRAASVELERALALDPGRAPAHFALADVTRDLGDPGRAIAEYTRGLVLDPDDADALFGRGVLLFGTGDREAAERDLAAAVELEPYHPRANLVLCKRAARKKDYVEAAARCGIAADYGVPIPDELAAELASHRGPD